MKQKRFRINDQVVSVIDQDLWIDLATGKKSQHAPGNSQILTVAGYGKYNYEIDSHRLVFREFPEQCYLEDYFESIMTATDLYLNLRDVKMRL